MAEKKAVKKKNYVGWIVLIIVIIILMFVLTQEKPVAPKTLSELQIDSCNTADKAGTCDSRLSEVGIVLKEECCGVLGKCC